MPHRMLQHQPACRWPDATPTGHGAVGAMVFGHIRHEQILLNHEGLYWPQATPALPDVSEHLSELRRLLAEGQWSQAALFLDDKLKEAGYEYSRPAPYHPAGMLRIFRDPGEGFSEYTRALDCRTGEVAVSWREGQAWLRRRLIASAVDDVVAVCFDATCPDGISARVQLLPFGLTPKGKGVEPVLNDPNVPVGLRFANEVEGGTLTLTGTYEADRLPFGAVARVVNVGGEAAPSEDGLGLDVTGTARLLVLIKLFANEQAEPAIERLRSELADLEPDYDALWQREADRRGPLFDRCTIDLGGGADREKTNEQLLAEAYRGQPSPALAERMYGFARHLMISSSTGTARWPANLQGVWNGDWKPAWESDFHNNVNIQMNYWAAGPGGLSEAADVMLGYYERFLDDSRANARNIYGCDGTLVAHCQTTHGMAFPGRWVNWTGGAAWLAQHFWDQYLFTGDEAFLRERAYPFMAEAGAFYEGFCTEGPDGKWVFSPSISPENRPALEGADVVTVNATMDIALARELMGNLLAACEVLGIASPHRDRWQSLLDKMPEYGLNEDGAVREWQDDRLPDNYHHRHLSHVYPVFPGREVTAEDDPELFEAFGVAVEKRLVVGLASQSGWSLAYLANVYARMGQPERAHECLALLSRSCVQDNLLCTHNDWRSMGVTLFWGYGTEVPFQIDANFGAAAAVLEMLAFSQPGRIRLLPGLPAAWGRGSVAKLSCRGNVSAEIA